jgi:signal transduction histidine kinase/GGDEF domain-containing protein/ActR/RegA family two-component response regulator
MKRMYKGYKIIAAAMILAALIQAVLYLFVSTSYSGSGTVSETEEKNLNQFAVQKSTFFKSKMTGRWSDISGTLSDADDVMKRILDENDLSVSEFCTNDAAKDEFLESTAGGLPDLFDLNTVSGVFIILTNDTNAPDDTKDQTCEGVFIRDTEPDKSFDDNSDMVLIRGSEKISEKCGIPRGVVWQPEFNFKASDENDFDYFYKPLKAAYSASVPESIALGCWNGSPGIDYDNDQSMIYYSVPLVYDGVVYGVMGVGILEERISYIMPAYDTDYGYMLVSLDTSELKGGTIDCNVQTAVGVNSTREVKTDEDITITRLKGSDTLYTLEDFETPTGEKLVCAISRIGIYPDDSPYKVGWFVLSVVSEENVMTRTDSVVRAALMASIISLLAGAAAAMFSTNSALRPVRSLAEYAEKAAGGENVSDLNTSDEDVNKISRILDSMNQSGRQYLQELRTERDRYLIALQASSNHILEYDCVNDVFTIYHPDINRSDSETKRSVYPDFKKLVCDGRVCPEEDIPHMLTFLEGNAGHTAEVRLYNKAMEPRLFRVNSRTVSDGDKVLRIIASSSDITDELEEEERRLDLRHRDRITDFYNRDYGRILVEKNIIERRDCYTVLIISIKNATGFIRINGSYCFDGVMEEMGRIVRMFLQKRDIVWRIRPAEIGIYIPGKRRGDLRADLDTVLSYLNELYKCTDKTQGIRCQIGFAECGPEIKPAEAIKRTRLAVAAASLGGYTDAVNYTDIENSAYATEAAAELITHEPVIDPAIFHSGYICTNNIISYALNMLDKSKDIDIAIHLILCKMQYLLGSNFITMYDMMDKTKTILVSYYWSGYGGTAPNTAPIEFDEYSYAEMEKLLIKNEPLIIDEKFELESPLLAEKVARIRCGGVITVVPAFDNEVPIGFLVFGGANVLSSDSIVNTVTELTKILAAYLLKSRTSTQSRAKSDFLSGMSHEIRTPMNAIMGLTTIALDNDKLPDETRDCLKKIDSSSQYLLKLINSILDLSRIESGKMTVEKIPLDLNALIDGVDPLIRVQTDKKGIFFKVSRRISYPYVIGDPLRLNQVLINILGNAVKFTEHGGVTLEVSEKEGTDNICYVQFIVEDTGVGIGGGNIERIFNSYEQESTTTTRKYGGTGLGLAISKSFVEMMDGKLQVESEVGSGTRFFFTLPMEKTDKVEAPDEEYVFNIDNFTGKRVLLAEDDETNTLIAKTLIEKDGITVETAENGKVAAEMFEKSDAGYYDAIFMDIRMPEMDGLDAAKLIRSMKKEDAATVPIIAMTANAFDEDIRKSAESGMNSHISKPIDMNRIRAVLGKLWNC